MAKPLDLDLHLSVANFAHSAGPLLLLRPRVLGSHVRGVPDVMEGKPRAYAIEIGHPGRWLYSFDIAFPPAMLWMRCPIRWMWTSTSPVTLRRISEG